MTDAALSERQRRRIHQVLIHAAEVCRLRSFDPYPNGSGNDFQAFATLTALAKDFGVTERQIGWHRSSCARCAEIRKQVEFK
jgi:hypothetical protein